VISFVIPRKKVHRVDVITVERIHAEIELHKSSYHVNATQMNPIKKIGSE